MTEHERFWAHESFAVVGQSAKKSFPVLTYRGLKKLGKPVFAVDSTAEEIDGDRCHADLRALPEPVEAVVLELPRDETLAGLRQVSNAGIGDVWIHMGTETPEALEFARQHGIQTHSGTCAVMYLTPGLTYHSIHKWVMKLAGRY